MTRQGTLFGQAGRKRHPCVRSFFDWLRGFSEFGTSTVERETKLPTVGTGKGARVATFVNEFWTSRQRAANSLHEVSYRACFKPQLPRFFIEAFTKPGDRVIDPFMGRGTTVLEAALLGRVGIGKDVSPISAAITEPRLSAPTMQEVEQRLAAIRLSCKADLPDELLVFYHEETLREIVPESPDRMLYVDHIEERGIALYEQVCSIDLEGIVAKPKISPYQAVKGQTTWIKVKNPDYSQAEGRQELFNKRR